jgi:hypothetical protein
VRRPERDLGYPVSRPVAPDPRRVRWRRNKPAGTFRGSDGPGTMTGVSAILAMRGPRFGIRAAPGFLAMTVVAPGGFAVWYRLACNEWPGQGPLLACTGADQTRSPSVARRKPGGPSGCRGC